MISISPANSYDIYLFTCLSYWFCFSAAAAAKSLQSFLTLCDPIDGSPPVSPVPGILQARTLEWVAIFFSNAWKWKVKVKSPSHAQLLATPWTAAYQAPLSMGFSRQEHWSGVPLPSPKLYAMISFLLNIHINTHAHTNKEHPEECKSSVYSRFLDSGIMGNILLFTCIFSFFTMNTDCSHFF